MGLQAVGPKKFKSQIKAGQDFLVRFQSDEDQQYSEDHKFFGGIGYGGDERPGARLRRNRCPRRTCDLPNTAGPHRFEIEPESPALL